MPSVLYALAAPSTPESAVVEIISRAQGGLCFIELANSPGMDAVFMQLYSSRMNAKRL